MFKTILKRDMFLTHGSSYLLGGSLHGHKNRGSNGDSEFA